MGLSIVLNIEIFSAFILVDAVVYSGNCQHTDKCILLKDYEHPDFHSCVRWFLENKLETVNI